MGGGRRIETNLKMYQNSTFRLQLQLGSFPGEPARWKSPFWEPLEKGGDCKIAFNIGAEIASLPRIHNPRDVVVAYKTKQFPYFSCTFQPGHQGFSRVWLMNH